MNTHDVLQVIKMKQVLLIGQICLLIVVWAVFAPALALSGTDADTVRAIDSSVTKTDNITVAAVTSEAPLYPISPERYEKLVSYSRFNSIWRFVSFFIGIATLAIILFTGLAARLRDWASKLKLRFFVVWGLLALVLIADYILGFPAHVYRSFIVENDYGFMNQTFLEWWLDDMLGLLILLAIGIIPMWFFYRLVNRFRKWWLVFSIGAVPFLVLMIVIAPVFISPLFNDFVPLEDKALETEILTLANEVGIEGSDIFQVNGSRQSTKVNAYVTGLFGTKRIVLYDTLIKEFARDEIRFVMGHEMGHYVMNHVWQGLLAAILMIGFALWVVSKTIHAVINRLKSRFGFDSLGDIASLPLVLIFLSVIMFVSQPLTNGFSRYMEHKADIFGMDVSGVSGESAAIAFDKLSVLNLSDPDPHPIIEFWFYTHPALKKRMEFVREYGR